LSTEIRDAVNDCRNRSQGRNMTLQELFLRSCVARKEGNICAAWRHVTVHKK
ncbi:hypothetical protein BaRGS_00004176, partial [Batillaria attramentaria]